MDAFTTNDLKALLEPRESPCLSIYLPTERGSGEKNAVRWKNQPECSGAAVAGDRH